MLRISKARPTKAALAVAALGIAVAMYLSDRGRDAVCVPGRMADLFPPRHVFGAFNGALPSFAHVFAFSPARTDGIVPRIR